MPKRSELERDRDSLAVYFDDLGINGNLSKETIKMLRCAFEFGQLCKELEIIHGRTLFQEIENGEMGND